MFLLLLFSSLDDVSGAVTADIAAVIGFSTVTDCWWCGWCFVCCCCCCNGSAAVSALSSSSSSSSFGKLASKFDSARIAVDAELPTLIVVSGDGDDAACCCCCCCLSFVSFSFGELPRLLQLVLLLVLLLLICFDTCWIRLVVGLSLCPLGWLSFLFCWFATLLISLPVCCVWNVFFLAELFLAAWFESELSDLQYSCWSPVRTNECHPRQVKKKAQARACVTQNIERNGMKIDKNWNYK